MLKKHKTYSKPKRPFDKNRLLEEEKIKKEYGLKNKKEIWKSEAKVKIMREKAKKLISASPEEQDALFKRFRKEGFKVNSISDVLSLDKKDYMERRLQTILMKKNFARTTSHARQLITHKKVFVGKNIVDSPSYIVPVDLENQISLKKESKKIKQKVEA